MTKTKYLVCDTWGNELVNFDNEKSRFVWLKRYCYHSGANWLIYDVSRFPYKVSSRVLYAVDE